MSGQFRAMIVAGVLVLASTVTAQSPVGWRTDDTGIYRNAQLPDTWSDGRNVVWKVDTKTWGNATPVIVGDRIFISEEKTQLVCLSKTDGKQLWRKELTYADMMSDADREQAKTDQATLSDLQDKIKPLRSQVRSLEKEASTLARQPDAKDKLDDVKKQLAELNPKLKAMEQQAERLTKWRDPATHGTNGYSSPTPVSDGKFVYVIYGTGLAGCYDLDGNRKWAKFIEKPTDGWGHSASPVLVDGGKKLIVHVLTMRALDTKTGEEVWKADGTKPHWGTPIAVTVGKTQVLLTTNGEVVRAGDGRILATRLASLVYNAPVFADGVAYYFNENGATAVKVSPKGDDDVEATKLWSAKVRNDRYYASPVIHDGVLYGIMQKGVLTAVDAAKGTVLYEKDLGLGGGTCYPSLVVAGDKLLASSDNGTTAILQPGREFKELARCKIDGFRASPVLEGSRLYIRSLKAMYCLGQ